MAKEENANPNNTKKNIMSNLETRKTSPHRRQPKHKCTITERRKSERTPKKRTPYEPHQKGMEVQVKATTEMMSKTRVDDEDKGVDFKDVTHRVTSGEFESFEGSKISKGNSHMTLRLIKDRSGHKMKPYQERRFLLTEVEELDSDDMIASIDTKNAEEEDEALIEYEKKLWECPKCQHFNTNDAGFCPNMVGGKLCGGSKKCKMLSWGNCFSQVCCEVVFFFVIHLSKTDISV